MSAGWKVTAILGSIVAITVGFIVGHEVTTNKKLAKLEQVLKDQEDLMNKARESDDGGSLETHQKIYQAAHEQYVNLIMHI